MSTRFPLFACALLAAACSREQPEPAPQAAATPEQSVCAEPRVTGRLPTTLHEASGLARGLTHPDVLWTISDDGPPVLFALDSTGSVRNRVAVRNARNRDWESLAVARCGTVMSLHRRPR
jgi:hypothetical protein